jgi:hypothetical protein
MVKDDYLILEHVRHVFLSVEIEPIFEAKSAEFVKHLLLLEKVDLLSFLAIALSVQSDELEEEILANLMHWLRHVDLTLELRVHRQEGRSVKLLERGHKHDL